MFEKIKEQYKQGMAEAEGMSDAEKRQYAKDQFTKQKGFRVAKRIYKVQVVFGLIGVALVILYVIFGFNQ